MKVSALTQIHNRVDLFAETIASVLNQSYPIHEFIIIDDGSTEDVRSLVESFKDDRLKYFYYKRVGVISKLRNIALSKATGDVVAFIDSDDLWHENKIKLHVEDMISSNCDISFSDCQLFNKDGWIEPTVCAGMNKENVNIFDELIIRNQSFAFGTNLFFKKIIAGKEIRLDEKLFVGEHDLITLCSAKNKATYIDHVLCFIRRHDRNTSQDNSIIEIISPLEYNHTAKKLLNENLISKKTYLKIRGRNYANVALIYMKRRRLKKSMRYLSAALASDLKWSYTRFFIKLVWYRILPQNTSTSAN